MFLPSVRRARLTRFISGLLIALGLAALAWAPASPASAQITERTELVAALDSAVQAHAADSTVAGVSVAVSRRGDMLLHEGYGQANLEFDVPMPKDAVFEIGSVTKQFTSAAILQLAAKGSINLDAPITDYLPGYNTRGHRVTVRHLLHHTSGIRDYTILSEFRTLRHRRLSRDTVLSFVEREPFRFAPGTAMSYSNSGYYLLGQIIESASGQSYAAYLQEHVLAAAGMESTFQCDERAVVEDRAHGYSWSKRGFRLRTRGSHHTWSYAAGGHCSTAADLVAWNQALHGGELLPDPTYKEMAASGRLADGTTLRYGMGLAVPEDEGRRALGHFGGLAGFTSASLYYPAADLIVVVLQNAWGPRPPWGLADELAQVALGPGDEPEPTPYRGDLSALTGRYAGPARGG